MNQDPAELRTFKLKLIEKENKWHGYETIIQET